MNAFDQLTKTDWAREFGLNKHLVEALDNKELASYYQKEKGDKKLWNFILYVDRPVLPHIYSYYGLPEDTRDFVQWVYNSVGYGSKVPKGVSETMDVFPNYSKLYQVYQQRSNLPAGNVLAFKNGDVKDSQGNKL